MKIALKSSLFKYCFKADNYNEFIRRVKLLAHYIQRENDKIFIQNLINDIKNKRKYFYEK